MLYRASIEADEGAPVRWEEDFAIGALADVSVHEQKDYGMVLDFAAHPDVLGLAAKHQVMLPQHFFPLNALCLKDTFIYPRADGEDTEDHQQTKCRRMVALSSP